MSVLKIQSNVEVGVFLQPLGKAFKNCYETLWTYKNKKQKDQTILLSSNYEVRIIQHPFVFLCREGFHLML